MFKRILVTTDGTTHSNRAVKAAAALAKATASELTIFHVVPSYQMPYSEGAPINWPSEAQYLKETAREAAAMLEKARAVAAVQKISPRMLQAFSNSPSEAIVKMAAKEKAGLIVMASHGRRGLEKLLLGSETQKVLARTKIPVMVVR
jgi:nucleotide-binding universal stress UspA family protein